MRRSGDVGQLGEGDAEKVGGERDGLAVEVAGGVGEALVAAIAVRPVVAELDVERFGLTVKKKRVVGGGVDLALGDVARVADGRARGAVNLRRAAQRIRILHGAGALDEFAAGDQLAHPRGAGDLAGVAAGRVHFRIERARAAAHRFERQRCRTIGEIGEPLSVRHSEGQHRCREVHAVDEGEAFLECGFHLVG